jgi:hypothetical protein
MIRLLSIFYALKSMLKKVMVTREFIQRVLGDNKWTVNFSVMLPEWFDDIYDIVKRVNRVFERVGKRQILYFWPMPYSFYTDILNKWVAGLGLVNPPIILVAKYSFWKNEYYPYVEHEVLHTMGLLADDHSNWNDYKEIAKYL